LARDGSGTYSLPAGSTIANGDTSDASDLNTPLADIAADLNVARPIVAGGTGATTAAAARANILGTSYSLGDIDYLTSGTAVTYTTPGGARALRVTAVGGGGGGGGATCSSVGHSSCSSGGSGAGYFELWIDSPAASYTYTVGAGGAGGAAGSNDGSAGGDTTWSDGTNTATADGGTGGDAHGGTGGTSGGNSRNGGTGNIGTFTNGFAFRGGASESSRVVGGSLANFGISGNSAFGGSVDSSAYTSGGINNTAGYGGGGGSVYISGVVTNGAGGDGGDGIIIVEVFY